MVAVGGAPSSLQQEQAGVRSLLHWQHTVATSSPICVHSPPARMGSWVGETHNTGKPKQKVQVGGFVSVGIEVRARDWRRESGTCLAYK